MKKNNSFKVAILDRNFKVESRACLMNKNKISCTNCNPCGILSGYGGAGKTGNVVTAASTGFVVAHNIIKNEK